MKIGLLGGSFDPIHAGHLALARGALTRLELDRVVFLPTAQPPHKPDRLLAPAHARYAMVELALLYEPCLEASAIELTIGRPSYTVETVERVRRERPEAEIHLLIGADSFVQLPQWRRWRDLVGLCHLAVLSRPGWDVEGESAELPPELRRIAASERVRLLESPPVEASSTRIRELLQRGERPPDGWLPKLVLDYCEKYELYR